MKNPFKLLRAVLLAILILIVVAVVAATLFGGRAVKIGIEAAATKTLSVGVSVDDVDLSIFGGKIGIQNLVVDNPPGYQHDKLLKIKDTKIAVDIKSLLSDVVNIKQINMDGMDVVLEQRGISGNNLQDIIKGLSAPTEAEDESKAEGKKLHIDNLDITNISVKVKLIPIPGKADTIPLKLPPIRMTDLGGDEKLNVAKLTTKILLAIAKGIAEKGVNILPTELITPLTSELKKLGKLPAFLKEHGDILEGGKQLGKDVLEGGKDVGEQIGDALKGLLKPKEKEE